MKAEDLVFNQQQSREVLVHGFTEHYRTQSGCSLHRNPLGHTAVLFLGLLPLFCVKLQGYLRLISSGWAFFLSSLFLMSCSLRWLLQVLHTVTGRMQHKASVLPVPQRGQRTAGKRHKQFNLSGRKLKSKDSQRENQQDISQLLGYLPFLHPISAIFHRDVGFCVPTNIQSDNCESRSFLTPTSKVVSSFAKKKEVSRGNSSGREAPFSARQITQLRLWVSPSWGQGEPPVWLGHQQLCRHSSLGHCWPCLILTLLT